MAQQTANNLLVWQNRWREPTVDELLSPMKAHHRRAFEKLDSYLQQMQAQRCVNWYGTGWHWTIEYRQAQTGRKANNGSSKKSQALCYLIPSAENPLMCIPLSEQVIEELPTRRLSRFIREGVKVAKYAVETHWATWSPNNQSEAEQLYDLVKRKSKILVQQSEAARKN